MTTESAKESGNCCDKSVPVGTDVCCAEDASAKAAGNQGCGCNENNDKGSESRKLACC